MTRAEREREFEALMERRLAAFDRLVAEARALYNTRNRQYRDAVKTRGLIGVLYEFNGLAGRLRGLRDETLRLYFSQYVEDEDGEHMGLVRNVLLDMVIYGLIALMFIEDGNILGEG